MHAVLIFLQQSTPAALGGGPPATDCIGGQQDAHLVKTDLLPLRLTSVYSADAMVASGVRPWHLMCCRSSASLGLLHAVVTAHEEHGQHHILGHEINAA